jgi:hypothetical protein
VLSERAARFGFRDRLRNRRFRRHLQRADAKMARGDLAAAKRLYGHVVEEATALYGPDTLVTLTAEQDLALTYADEPPEALRRLHELLPKLGTVAGNEDRRTLKVRRDIATITGMGGDDGGARDLFQSLLVDYERLFPDDEDLPAIRQMLEYATEQAQGSV